MKPGTRNSLALTAILAAAVGGTVLVLLLDRPPGDEAISVPGAPERQPPPAPVAGDGAAGRAVEASGKAGTLPGLPGKPPEAETKAPAAGEGPGAALPSAGPGEIAGRTVDARTRKPVQASVSLEDASGNAVAQGVAAASGDFRLTGLPAGTALVLNARKDGYEAVARKDLVLAEGAGLTLGEIALAPLPLLRGTVADDAGRPAAGASVALARESAMKIGPDLDLGEIFKTIAHPDQVAARTATGPDGAFAFYPGDTPDGDFGLRVAAPGFATAIVHGVEVRAGKEGPSHSVVLEKPAALSGKVEDPQKGGVEGAFLVALGEPDQRQMLSGTFAFDKRWTESGPDGRFRFEDVPQGRVTLIVRKEGYANTVEESVELPAEDVTITLRTGSLLRGRIVDDATGKPVVGARILVMTKGGEGGGFGQTASDAEGTYEVTGLSPGEYEVMVSAPGHSGAKLEADGRAGGVVVLDARLKKGIRMAGRVIEDGTRRAIAGAKVAVFPFGDDFPLGGNAPKTESGPDGAFVLEGVRVLERGGNPASGASPRRPSVMLMASRPGWFLEEPVMVEPEAGLENVEIVMKPACCVSGRAVDPDGRPVQGAGVTLTGGNDMDVLFRFSGLGDPTPSPTDAEGKFTIHARSGQGKPSRLEVRHPAWAFEAVELRDLAIGKQTEEILVRLSAGGRIEGTVRNEKSEPAGGLRVEYTYLADAQGKEWERERSPLGGETPAQVTAGLDGAFRIEHLRAGEWGLTLKSGKTDAAPLEKVRILEGKTVHADLRVSSLLSLSGVVVDDAGSPLKDAVVIIQQSTESTNRHIQTRTDGMFRFDGLLPGEYVATVWCAGHQPAGSIRIQAGSAGERIVLKRELSIRGVVVDENGAPVARTDIQALPIPGAGGEPADDGLRDASKSVEATTGRDGNFQLGGLAAGEYELTVWTVRGGERRATRVQAAAGAAGVRVVVPGGAGK